MVTVVPQSSFRHLAPNALTKPRENKSMLLAGVGRTTLTPPLGTPLVGYGGREQRG